MQRIRGEGLRSLICKHLRIRLTPTAVRGGSTESVFADQIGMRRTRLRKKGITRLRASRPHPGRHSWGGKRGLKSSPRPISVLQKCLRPRSAALAVLTSRRTLSPAWRLWAPAAPLHLGVLGYFCNTLLGWRYRHIVSRFMVINDQHKSRLLTSSADTGDKAACTWPYPVCRPVRSSGLETGRRCSS